MIFFFFQKLCLWCRVKEDIVTPEVIQMSMSSPRSFTVLCFPFRSRIHSEVTCSLKSVSAFIALPVDVQGSSLKHKHSRQESLLPLLGTLFPSKVTSRHSRGEDLAMSFEGPHSIHYSWAQVEHESITGVSCLGPLGHAQRIGVPEPRRTASLLL